MEKIKFILIDEKQGWEPNLNDSDMLLLGLKALHVRNSSSGGWDIIATPRETDFPSLGGIQVDSQISKREDAEKIALLWMAGRIMKRTADNFLQAAYLHSYRHPESPQAGAAHAAAKKFKESADGVQSQFSALEHKNLCEALPPALETARAALTEFENKPKSNCTETQAADQETADDFKGLTETLAMAKELAHNFHRSAGIEPTQKISVKKIDEKGR